MAKQTTITIKGVDYTLKTSFRALMQWEEMTGRNANELNDSVTDGLKLLYCMLATANKDFPLSYEQVIDATEESPALYVDFKIYLLSLVEPEKATVKKKVEKR